MSDSSLGHLPEKPKWEFDESVTKCFEDMLERSIPEYPAMRRAVFQIACLYAREGTDILDLGCSRGESCWPMVERYGATLRYTMCDVSGPMLEECRSRFKGYIDTGVARVIEHDLRKGIPACRPSVAFAVLTLQFLPIEHRAKAVQAIHDALVPGGAVILVEKILGSCAEIDGRFVELYHEMKASNGYSREEIDRKRLSLEGVLVPISAKWNEDLLRSAGFERIDCFYRMLNFAGWVAVKSAR